MDIPKMATEGEGSSIWLRLCEGQKDGICDCLYIFHFFHANTTLIVGDIRVPGATISST